MDQYLSLRMTYLSNILSIIACSLLIGVCNDQGRKKSKKIVVASDTTVEEIMAIDFNQKDNVGIPRIVNFDGNCKYADQITQIDGFKLLRAKENSLGYIRIRSDASCFEPKYCNRNLIGTIKSGSLLFGIGPLKNAKFSAGLAYKIAIQDSLGNTCFGYVSTTVVKSNFNN